MKTFVSAVALVLLVGGGVAFSQGQGGQDKPDPQKRVDSVEVELAAQKKKCEELAADLESTKVLLAKTLDEAERLGFTYGINPDSRTTLLSGWREQLAAAQQPVPTAPAPKADAPKPGTKKP